jgi:hypothetical protein
MLRRNPSIIEVSEEILPWEQEQEADIESAATDAEPVDALQPPTREDAPWPGPAPHDPTAPVVREEDGVPVMPKPQPTASPDLTVFPEDAPAPAVPEQEAAATSPPADAHGPKRLAAPARLARSARTRRQHVRGAAQPRRALAGCALLAVGIAAVLLSRPAPEERPQESQRAAATATPRAPTVTEPPAEPAGPDPGVERRRAQRARAAAEQAVERAQRRAQAAEQARRRAERRAQELREQRDDSAPAPSGESPAPAPAPAPPAPAAPAPTEPAPAPDPAEREFGIGP